MLKVQITFLLLVFSCSQVLANSSNSLNLQLPSGGSSHGTDRIKAGDLDCTNSIGGATNFEFGLTGIVNNAVAPVIGKKDPDNPQTKDLGIYARIIIPLDAPRERINCNTLYQLELEKKRMEVAKLKQEIVNLRNLQFAKDEE